MANPFPSPLFSQLLCRDSVKKWLNKLGHPTLTLIPTGSHNRAQTWEWQQSSRRSLYIEHENISATDENHRGDGEQTRGPGQYPRRNGDGGSTDHVEWRPPDGRPLASSLSSPWSPEYKVPGLFSHFQVPLRIGNNSLVFLSPVYSKLDTLRVNKVFLFLPFWGEPSDKRVRGVEEEKRTTKILTLGGEG